MINGKNKTNNVVLSLGGNQGNVIQSFENAISLIEGEIGKLTKSSSLYQTSAWGVHNQPDFLNQVIEITTTLNPTECLNICMEIEKKLGRVRNKTNRWKERVIDIDILFYNEAIISLPDLEIPHPQIPYRKFILIPLMEIMPHFIHPVLKKTIKFLSKSCVDKLDVTKK